MSFVIVTDSAANIPTPMAQELKITVIPFSYFIEGKEYICHNTESFDSKAYYDSIRAGTLVSTSQVTPQKYIDTFSPILKDGKDILFIGLSSGVSGSFSSAGTAAAQLKESYPQRTIALVDSLGASLGEGLLALYAAEFKASGKTLSETLKLVSDIRDRMCQVFTVDSLAHLRRTGRCSNITAVIGTLLHIKPVLKGDETGHIVSFKKIKGRAAAICELAALYEAHAIDPQVQTVGISHGDCLQDALELEKLIRQKNPPAKIVTVCHEPATGSHVGPGMLALYFVGGSGVRSI